VRNSFHRLTQDPADRQGTAPGKVMLNADRFEQGLETILGLAVDLRNQGPLVVTLLKDTHAKLRAIKDAGRVAGHAALEGTTLETKVRFPLVKAGVPLLRVYVGGEYDPLAGKVDGAAVDGHVVLIAIQQTEELYT